MASSTVNGAHNDGQNQVMSVIGVIGTLGTADTQGTALTLPIGVAPSTGAMYVHDLSGAAGTTNVQGSVQVTGGSIVVTDGTIGTIANVGKIHNAGTLAGGTLGVVSALTSGTVSVNTPGTITSGTVSVNTPGTITSGSIAVTAGSFVGTVSVNTPGTLTSGSIAVTAGTVGGKAASGAASVANPVQIAGTDGGGTVYSPFITTGGILKVVDTAGTIASGSVAVTAGSFVGTINSGSVVVTAGTGIITVGTVGGKAASGAAAVANPVQIAGTDGGGTVYSPFITTGGIVKVVDTAGTISSGSIVVTAGTIGDATVKIGTINSGTINAGTINTGTINAGTIRIDPIPVVNTISSVGTTGTTAIGTLLGTSTIGVGTGVYITRFHVLVISGTPEINLSFGTQKVNNQVIAHGLFPAGGGVAEVIHYPHAFGTTQSPLTYEIVSGAGTVSWGVDYFLHT